MNCKRAGALIINSDMDKCLMVFQKSSLLWGIPKGQKEKNEDCYICMVREVKEEVGLNLNNLKFEILESITIHDESYVYIIKIFLDPLPICSPPFEEGNDNHEIEKIEWVNIEDACKRKNNSITKHALYKLKKYLSF
jgi:mRNA-decapping enzyme subunit 2